jgi:hypothetical protein
MSATSTAERGSVTVFVSVAAVALMLMAGLVVDGGAKVRAIQRADAVAAEAARAAGQAIVLADAVVGNPPRADLVAAVRAAETYLAAQGVAGNVEVLDRGAQVRVRVQTSTPTVFLGLIGISSLNVTGEATVTLVRGISGALP